MTREEKVLLDKINNSRTVNFTKDDLRLMVRMCGSLRKRISKSDLSRLRRLAARA